MARIFFGKILQGYRTLTGSYFSDAQGALSDVSEDDVRALVAGGCVDREIATQAVLSGIQVVSGDASKVLSGAGTFVMATGAAVNVIMVQGNNTGTYAVSQITATNKLLVGFATQDNLATTAFNWSPSNFALVSNLINSSHGWRVSAGHVIDPTGTDWTKFSLIWLYS